MTLLSGDRLKIDNLFAPGSRPGKQASSVDLTIGQIFDHNGRKVEGHFCLEPGHMVQVCSAEVFNLPANVTTHVTYKTTLTKQGIWALTVGIVDPGWDGPVATTLLNFSQKRFAVCIGEPFLRASFFEHDPVPSNSLRRAPPIEKYILELQKSAVTDFPKTFLDREQISKEAGESVLKKIREEGIAWIAGIAFVFALVQIIAMYIAPAYTSRPSETDLKVLREEIQVLRDRIKEMQVPAKP